MNHNRNRLLYLLMASAVICLGLLSGKMTDHLPNLVNLVLGDTLGVNDLLTFWNGFQKLVRDEGCGSWPGILFSHRIESGLSC